MIFSTVVSKEGEPLQLESCNSFSLCVFFKNLILHCSHLYRLPWHLLIWKAFFSYEKQQHIVIQHFPSIVNCLLLPEHRTTFRSSFYNCYSSTGKLFPTGIIWYFFSFSLFQSPPSASIRRQVCLSCPERTDSPPGNEIHSERILQPWLQFPVV